MNTETQTPAEAEAAAQAARQVTDALRAEEERQARLLYPLMAVQMARDAASSEAVRRAEGSTAKLEASYASIHPTAKPQAEVPADVDDEGFRVGPSPSYEEPEIDAAALAAFMPTATELGMTPEAAKRALTLHATELGKLRSQGESLIAGWAEQTRRDLSPTDIDTAHKLVHDYGDPKLIELLEVSGVGSNPSLIRFIASIAKGKGRAVKSESDFLTELYPSTPQGGR